MKWWTLGYIDDQMYSVKISTQTISRFLHKLEFQLSANMAKIDYRVGEIQKIKVNQIGLKKYFAHLRWMHGIIPTEWEEAPQVFGTVGSKSWIMNVSLNLVVKAWQTLPHHILSSTYGDTVMSTDRATLIMGIMKGYKFDIAKRIAMEIYNQVVGPNTVLVFCTC